MIFNHQKKGPQVQEPVRHDAAQRRVVDVEAMLECLDQSARNVGGDGGKQAKLTGRKYRRQHGHVQDPRSLTYSLPDMAQELLIRQVFRRRRIVQLSGRFWKCRHAQQVFDQVGQFDLSRFRT